MHEQQLERWMAHYTGYLLRIGYYYTKDLEKSKDLVQDVFIRCYYSNYDEQGKEKAYLAKLMRNACKDYVKSWSYRMIRLQQLTKEQFVKQRDVVVVAEEHALLDEAILALKLPLREVIVFYYLEELTTREIAQLIGTPESTVKSRLQRARQQLKRLIDDEQWEVLTYETLSDA